MPGAVPRPPEVDSNAFQAGLERATADMANAAAYKPPAAFHRMADGFNAFVHEAPCPCCGYGHYTDTSTTETDSSNAA